MISDLQSSINTDSNNSNSDHEYEVSEEENENLNGKSAGWVDSINKILKTNKPKGKKSLVLSKAKKLTDVKKKKPVDFEVALGDGTVKEEVQLEEEEEPKEPPRKKKREFNDIRVKPNILEKDRERLLMKIATKGVVELFNAVKTHQKDLNKKLDAAGPLDVRKEKVMKNIDKRAFLDVLMGEKSTAVEECEKEENEEGTWSVLRDDFMMGTKLKDWDKDVEAEDEEELEVESD